MYIKINKQKYAVKNPVQSKPFGTWFKISLIDRETLNLPIDGIIIVYSDDNFELLQINSKDYDRQTYEQATGILTFTNEPEEIKLPISYNVPEEQKKMIALMSECCKNIIISGITIDNDSYSLKLEDQLNLLTLENMIKSGVSNVSYHANGQLTRIYSAEEFMKIISAANQWKLFHENYFNSLRNYIYQLDNVSDIWGIYYGIDIPLEYQTETLQQILQSNLNSNFFPLDNETL